MSFEEWEIKDRVDWFIFLRWLAIFGAICTILFATQILKIELPVFKLFFIIFIMIIYNIVFSLYSLLFFKKRIDTIGVKASIRFATIQIIVDLFILTLIIHFSGGVENPFSFYYIFHILISSILLSTKQAYYQASIAIILFATNTVLESYEIIPHFSLGIINEAPLYKNKYYCISIFFVFATTMYLSVYMTTSITSKLRKRRNDIIDLKNELERKNEELKEIQENLIKSEKLAAVGNLATGVAHQINNPLTTILTFSLLSLKKTTDENTKKKLEVIVNETTRCRNIIRDLLNFAGMNEPQLKRSNINGLIEKALLHIQLYDSKIDIQKKVSDDLPEILIDSNQILEVIINIITNAIEAMPDGGRLTIVTRLTVNRKYVVIEFIDNGYGISEENMGKIFNPFFTTKDKGTGLGLAVAHGIIQKHDGIIDVNSEKGKGTTFIIKLLVNHEVND